MRDHQAIVIEEFNGLWKRGDDEACPLDHFTDCNNIEYIQSGFKTRRGIAVYQVGPVPGVTLRNVARIYTYVRQNVESLLVLDTAGNIYHTGSPTPFTAILSIPAMIDFAFVNIAGRAYISPHNGVTGLPDEFLYVYMGDGTLARKAGGDGPVGTPMTYTVLGSGHVERGIHIIGVVYETNTGFLTQIGITNLVAATTPTDLAQLQIDNIPVSPNSYVVARQLVSTKAIDPSLYTGDLQGYQFYKVPDSRIPDNTTTTKIISYYDSELLEDASYLFDIFSEMKAGVALTTYHDRMALLAQYGKPSPITKDDEFSLQHTAWLSVKGEPEAFNQVDGLIVTPADGLPLTTAQEYRDVFYIFKKTRTYAYNDNGDVPSSWPLTIIDQGIGASVHGIAAVLDSGGVNADYLLLIDYSGIMLFNGAYLRPELSWKIKDYWFALDRDEFLNMQIVNDSLEQNIYVTLPNQKILLGDYSNGLDPKNIRWALWSFLNQTTTITLIETNRLVIGSRALVS